MEMKNVSGKPGLLNLENRSGSGSGKRQMDTLSPPQSPPYTHPHPHPHTHHHHQHRHPSPPRSPTEKLHPAVVSGNEAVCDSASDRSGVRLTPVCESVSDRETEAEKEEDDSDNEDCEAGLNSEREPGESHHRRPPFGMSWWRPLSHAVSFVVHLGTRRRRLAGLATVSLLDLRGRGATFGSNLGRVEAGFLELVRLGDLSEVEEYLKTSPRCNINTHRDSVPIAT